MSFFSPSAFRLSASIAVSALPTIGPMRRLRRIAFAAERMNCRVVSVVIFTGCYTVFFAVWVREGRRAVLQTFTNPCKSIFPICGTAMDAGCPGASEAQTAARLIPQAIQRRPDLRSVREEG